MDLTISSNTQSAANGVFDSTLVHLYDCQNLLHLARDKSPAARTDLIDNMTAFFDLNLKETEKELASDVLLSLIKQAERDLRQALAERLSQNDKVPLRVILTLANDEISVAESVLRNSVVLNELDLMYIIMAHDADYWTAIAQRRDLTDNIVNSLAGKRDVQTSKALLENQHISLPKSVLEIFADMARTARELNIPLIHRPELPAELAQSLYNEVSEELRAVLVKKFNDVEFAEVLDTSLAEIQTVIIKATVKNGILEKNNITAGSVNRPPATPTKMIEALRLGQLTYFKALFAEYTGLKTCMIDTLLKQKGGRGFAIACRAKKMERPDFMTLFMLKSAIASASKIVDHGELAQALSAFDKLDTDYANKMLGKAINAQGDFSLT